MSETKGLSQRTLQIAQIMFSSKQKDEVEELLLSECAYSLVPDESEEWDQLRERIQLGVLKVSEGNVDKLLSAIVLARTDWRDLLMAAGFGYSVTEHENWAADILKSARGD